ncbi:DNA-binding transcriptional regulator, XRE-family HTH domain [Succinivibrio dextrinosolvens DSM 3072]|uniref:DNA-binding transcriptional regulator, XRE-family HTH domain n=1 Tax=Succinivibrio dextrinosolvens DSM 3072 TaxID=1123324 RepID=A0A1T4VMN2_9GAMM|nr:helix-turn-helix transcriptional regulator [Succinivibrio dextrinosolvens]SKA66196.1 DNA-binding transcriptional regulator, XRE-family HTH domain [Succinivibrio dextrinosolvens DSM 3072]
MNFNESIFLCDYLKTYFPDLSVDDDESLFEEAYLWALKLNHKHFRKKLKEYRENCGYSQTSISKALNVTQATYSSWETGKHIPKVEFIKKLTDLLNLQDPVQFIVSAINKPFGSKSVPVLPPNFFVGLKPEIINTELEKYLSETSCIETFRILESEKYDFAFKVTDTLMEGTQKKITKDSYLLCSFCSPQGLTKYQLLKFVSGMVAIVSCKGNSAIIREVQFSEKEEIVSLLIWNTRINPELGIFLGDDAGNNYSKKPIKIRENYSPDEIEILGIAVSGYYSIQTL